MMSPHWKWVRELPRHLPARRYSDNEPAQGKTRSEEQQSRIKLANGATGDDIDSKSGATEPVCSLASGEENEENETEPVCSETSVQLEKCPKTLPEATQTLSAPASPWNTTQFGTNLDTEPKELPLRCGLNAQQMAMGEGQMMMGPDDTNRVAVMAVQGVDHLWHRKSSLVLMQELHWASSRTLPPAPVI
jgi:hypothetical protein